MAIYTGKTNMIDKVVVTNGSTPEEMDYVYVINAAGKRELVFEQKPPAPDDNTQEAVPVKTKWTASLTKAVGLRRPYPSERNPIWADGFELFYPSEFRLTGTPILQKQYNYKNHNNKTYTNWLKFREENIVVIDNEQRTIMPNRLQNYAVNTNESRYPKPYFPADSELYEYSYGGIIGFGVSGKGPTYYVVDPTYMKLGYNAGFFSTPSYTCYEIPKRLSLDESGYSGLDLSIDSHGTTVRTYCGVNITKTNKLHYISITSRIIVKEGNSPQQVYSDFYSINLKVNEEGKEGVEPSSMVTTQGAVYPYNSDRLMIGLGSGQLHLNIKEKK